MWVKHLSSLWLTSWLLLNTGAGIGLVENAEFPEFFPTIALISGCLTGHGLTGLSTEEQTHFITVTCGDSSFVFLSPASLVSSSSLTSHSHVSPHLASAVFLPPLPFSSVYLVPHTYPVYGGDRHTHYITHIPQWAHMSQRCAILCGIALPRLYQESSMKAFSTRKHGLSGLCTS